MGKAFSTKKIPIARDPIATYPVPPLEEFLKDPIGYKYVRLQLAKTMQNENLDAYTECLEYRKSPSDEKLQEIWKKYIATDAPERVNLTGDTFEDIQKYIKNPTKPTDDLLDNTIAELLKLVDQNCWSSFRYVLI